MRTPRPVPDRLASHPFSRDEALALIGRGELAGPSYRLITRGAYWLAGEEMTHGRSIQAFRAVLPEQAVLRGLSAAWALGVRLAGPDDPVEVVMSHRERVRGRAGLTVSGERVPADEVVDTDLGPATRHPRTAFDLARRLPLADAVAVVDALLRAGQLPPDALLETLDRHTGTRGRRQALVVAGLVDPRAESPRESLLRVALVQAGLPAPTPQVQVSHRGAVVARLDLAWPEHRVAVEYDGSHHRHPQQHSRDLTRHNTLRSLGWQVFQVDASLWSHAERFADLVESVRRALAQRAPSHN